MPDARLQAVFDAQNYQEALLLFQQMQAQQSQARAPEQVSMTDLQALAYDDFATAPVLCNRPLLGYLNDKRRMTQQASRWLLGAALVTMLLEALIGFTLWPFSLALASFYGILAFRFHRKTLFKPTQTKQIVREASRLLHHPWLSWAAIVISGAVAILMMLLSLSVLPDLFVGQVTTVLSIHFLVATGLACGMWWATVQQEQQINKLRRKRKNV
ncbi:hypothetical protein G4Y79_07750 [Phototrophicus methaneseepsis]|uniref:Uncharacterized protein n=1 Tax=Phototrophicus methaneseepsis TaxID=2710758 RepID=A0A7S8EC66_9CHLR|nr:hypothetical protein [Phototrophicus methaneseepsis]QPC84257.1 hypothetical protein G4Y79_07750 [Phototrophicus methaneseepsis]